MIDGVVVIGAGGHAKVCIELLRAMGDDVAYCVGGDDQSGTCVGVEILGGDHHLPELFAAGHRRLFVAIGSNAGRDRLGAAASASGWELVNAISPAATVSPSARLGVGVAVMAGAVINAESVISDLAIVNTGATIDHDGVIGRAVHVAPQNGLAGNVMVGDHSFLGVGCSVIPGTAIGKRVTVGAGSVVIRDLPDDVTAVGVPARIIRTRS